MDINDVAQQIFARIGCFDIAEWLGNLAQTLGIDSTELMPVPVVESKTVTIEGKGLKLTVRYRHTNDMVNSDPMYWTLTDAEFNLVGNSEGRWDGALPCGLDRHASTPESAGALLGDGTYGLKPENIAAGDFRQTFFLNDNRVAGITWKRTLVGIDHLHLIRLGGNIPFVPANLQCVCN